VAVAALAAYGAAAWLNSDDVLYGTAAGLSPGDVVGALLWSVSLFYASPLQLLLLFLGRIDVERPSDVTLLCVVRGSLRRASLSLALTRRRARAQAAGARHAAAGGGGELRGAAGAAVRICFPCWVATRS